MLPKLQQSSIANSLRRDNLASQIQCTYTYMQVKINSKVYLANRIISLISLGKINTLLKIPILLLEIFLKSIYQKKK